MQHIEFIHSNHFENNYHRVAPPAPLRHFIDFFWETKFDSLWKQYPKGFSDAQFPNIGYTYIINLGTPFIMQVEDKKFSMKTDGFLPRYHAIECFHKPGNHFFGIKFRISPVLFQKKINFSEYRGYVFPLSYLLEPPIIEQVKKTASFTERTKALTNYFTALLARHKDTAAGTAIVSQILDSSFHHNRFELSLREEAARYKISERTLQRYFEAATGISGKKALQVMRIRKALAHLAGSPGSFRFDLYGYYDYSHFYKHLKQFLQNNTLKLSKPHLQLLQTLHEKGR